jgi:hypothetical protein
MMWCGECKTDRHTRVEEKGWQGDGNPWMNIKCEECFQNWFLSGKMLKGVIVVWDAQEIQS